MKRALIALVVVVIVLVAISGVVLRDYNQLDTERHDIAAQWTQLDSDMRHRAALVGNLIEPFKAISNVNEEEHAAISEARNAQAALLIAQSKRQEMAANRRLSTAIARLLVLKGRFRQLASNQTLQDDLADAEQSIADGRKNYNDAIQKYNTDLQLFPQNVTAAIFHFRRDDAYFQTPEQNKDRVQ
jgi:LemA protein